VSIYLGETPLANNAVSRNIGEIIQSTIPLNDAGLHLLDGALISSTGSYAKFVNYIAGLVSNYPDLFTTEANWQSSVSTYGVCGKFVYDSTNNTVRLPKITGFTEGTIDPTTLGNLTQAGLPNITGRFGASIPANHAKSASGAFQGITIGSSSSLDMGGGSAVSLAAGTVYGYDFNASHSSSIYGNSSTVQPQAIKVLYYIVIASSITNELNLDVADMADKDFSNITSTGTSLASSWSMPSSRYIDLTLGASDSTYTAPANGWIEFVKESTGSQYFQFRNYTSGWFNNVSTPSSGQYLSIFAPVYKGDTFKIEYNLGGVTARFRFYYTEGEN
jgi:hypothetical protein